MKVERLHHVSLLVTDLERAKAFYGGVLGLQETKRPPFGFPGAWYQIGEDQIHLIVYPEKAPVPDGIDTKDAHLALRVANFWQAVERLEQHNVEVVKKPQNLTDWPQAYCTDPDGNVIELNAAGVD